MRRLSEVEEAKSLMREAMDWSTFTWLFEKHRIRETADRANAALDKLNHTIKAHWAPDVIVAFKQLTVKSNGSSPKNGNSHNADSTALDSQIKLLLAKVKEADDAARRARMKAEDTFDQAERKMSTDLAREGCSQAIHSWELHEKAIRRAEAVSNSTEIDD